MLVLIQPLTMENLTKEKEEESKTTEELEKPEGVDKKKRDRNRRRKWYIKSQKMDF